VMDQKTMRPFTKEPGSRCVLERVLDFVFISDSRIQILLSIFFHMHKVQGQYIKICRDGGRQNHEWGL
jgi:hypothetical protein